MSSYALTQFEPTAARRAFPCFDEPEMKATYDVTLISRTETVSLSNMNVLSTKHVGPDAKLPRTELLTEDFFASTVAVGKIEGKTEGKTEGETEKVEVVEKDGKPKYAGEYKNDWEVITFDTSVKMSTCTSSSPSPQ